MKKIEKAEKAENIENIEHLFLKRFPEEQFSAPERRQKNFIGYEYKELTADSSRISLLLDGYESFGWELDEKVQEGGIYFSANSSYTNSRKQAVIHLKRNRKIINKMELTRLQRNFEACIREIDTLERTKTFSATIYAILAGILGTAFLAGSTFAVTAQPPHYILCILFAVPGFLGWILPYFLYKKLAEKQTERLTPLIEAKYDEIYELCEKGNKLLY